MVNPVKILFFYQYFGTPKGSWSTRVYELTRRWVADGYDVTVVTAPYDKSDIKASSFISNQEIEGIKLIIINSGDSNKLSIFKRVFRAIRFSLVAIKYAMSLNYDVCIASSGPITIGLPLIIANRLKGKRAIFEVRDLWPAGGIEMGLIKSNWQKKLALYFEKLCYNSSDLIVTASIGQKNHIEKRFPNKRIEVIPNASDLDLFGGEVIGDLPDWLDGKILFTHIGSLGMIHNTQYWLEVAKELSKIDVNNKIKLVFIGDGVDKDHLVNEKNKFNLDNLHFLGLKPKAELPLWVKKSRATLFATLENPVQNACSPNKIFDSFAAGVPIIQTSTGWIGDMVEREYCGINVPLDHPRIAAEKIMWLAENEEVANEMGKNATRLAQTDFNRVLLAEKYLTFIKEVVNG